VHARSLRGVGTAAIVVALLSMAAGCSTATAPSPSPSGAPVITPTEIPDAEPEFLPEGTAAENRDYFDYVVSRHIADEGALGRDGFTTALVAAGWTPDTIEATADVTPLGNAADATTFAVRMGDDCLVGQWNGTYSSAIAPLLASGTCLVGAQQPAG
jgi:hypothetical protein